MPLFGLICADLLFAVQSHIPTFHVVPDYLEFVPPMWNQEPIHGMSLFAVNSARVQTQQL